MLYIEYNFYRWLADVGPTLARRSKSRWPNVGSQRRTDGCADVGPTSVRRRNAIWVVSPVFGVNVPVLGSLSDIRMRPCESVANHPLPCMFYVSFKQFKISTSDFGTMSMCRRFRACTYELLTVVTEGVVHGVHKVVIQSSFGVTRRHKVS